MNHSTKSLLRAQARARRDAWPEAERQTLANHAAAHLLAWCQHHLIVRASRPAPCVALYAARSSELDTHPLRQALHRAGYRVALPRVNGGPGARMLSFATVEAQTPLAVSSWGVREPPMEHLANHSVAVEDCALVIVPCLLVDHAGYRLGYGQGLYDRALAQFGGLVVCLAYHFQRVPHLPAEPHDVPVHHVATEAGVNRVVDPL